MGNSRFKFRAWNLDYKWMDYDFYVSSHGVFFRPASKTYDTPNTEIEEEPNLILMQFTGLKDKNGNDIYEGDIIAFGEDDIEKPRLGMYGELGFVVFFECAFCVYMSESGRVVRLDDHNQFSDGKPCRIAIGNIHEHPHLLQKEQN